MISKALTSADLKSKVGVDQTLMVLMLPYYLIISENFVNELIAFTLVGIQWLSMSGTALGTHKVS
jgi:hypothetical protein